MTPPPAFILFTDDHARGIAACFGGDAPAWAAVVSPIVSAVPALPGATKSIAVFFDREGQASRSIQIMHEDMRTRGQIIGLDAAQLRGLGEWLAKNGRRAGEPVATLIASGASAMSVSQREA